MGDQDPYLDPKTGLLQNKLGATSQAQLEQLEVAFSSVRHLELHENPIPGDFDLKHLQAIHRHLFGDVYPWVGEIRTVIIDKAQTRFAMPERIEAEGGKLLRLLARENHLKGLDPATFAARAGEYMGEINVLHPFREGNGRTQRAFMSQLAHQAGYALTWVGITRDEMTQACVDAFYGDSSGLAGLIARNLVDLEHAKAYELAHAKLGTIPIELKMASAGGEYNGRVIGETSRYVVQEMTGQPGQVVLHRRSQLANVSELQADQPALIRYPHGNAGVVACERDAGVADRERSREVGPRGR